MRSCCTERPRVYWNAHFEGGLSPPSKCAGSEDIRPRARGLRCARWEIMQTTKSWRGAALSHHRMCKFLSAPNFLTRRATLSTCRFPPPRRGRVVRLAAARIIYLLFLLFKVDPLSLPPSLSCLCGCDIEDASRVREPTGFRFFFPSVRAPLLRRRPRSNYSAAFWAERGEKLFAEIGRAVRDT